MTNSRLESSQVTGNEELIASFWTGGWCPTVEPGVVYGEGCLGLDDVSPPFRNRRSSLRTWQLGRDMQPSDAKRAR